MIASGFSLFLAQAASSDVPDHFAWGAGTWALAAAGALFIGLNKGGLPGIGIFTAILFALLLPAKVSTGFVLPLLIVGDIGACLFLFRHDARWDLIRRLLPPTLLGVVLGFLLMDRIPETLYRPLIGWLTLGLAALQLIRDNTGNRLDQVVASHHYGRGMGVLTGVTTMLANAAGPVSTLYFLSLRLPKWEMVGSIAWLFLITNLCKVPFSAKMGLITGHSLLFAAALAPLVALGLWLGRRIAAKIPQKAFEQGALWLSVLAALKLLWR
ncbi:hypothetical protein SAMN05444156_1017 [Verrucomicrobium sp. GAS474]|uniref:sulfite exporter TauE/SafE family protein n=1 Tax=Verrucomicrobium sp. GAS474 TaxID=1882831 RepID=UPI00087BDC54|nr:sulfite exporter TauE/SafE family protein [Verrucomicrobium sp. GAS474]SDT95212.1 hypothetical protein SAMN05444156_1017 [Verrucomicrobium sp. GAS474]